MKAFLAPTTSGALLATALFCALTAPTAHAQKTYRCGSTYQSFPCTGPTAPAAGGGAATKGATVAGKPVAPATAPVAAPATAPANAPMTEAEKKAAEAKAAAAEKKAKCDKMVSELNYIIAQQKSGSSQTTMERIAAERKQSEAELKKAGCSV